MIHTKSLIRRLTHLPWLLAAGLVLGWVGNASAQSIKLTLDKYEINERVKGTDAKVRGGATVTVKAQFLDADGKAKNVGQDTYVAITVPTTTAPSPTTYQLNGLGLLKIAKDGSTGELPITVYPIQVPAGTTVDLGSSFSRGDAATIDAEITFRIVDQDATGGDANGDADAADTTPHGTRTVRLSVAPQEIGNESDTMDFKVTATLEGKEVNASAGDLSFSLQAIKPPSDTTPTLFTPAGYQPGETGALFNNAVNTDVERVAARDVDYNVPGGLGKITIPAGDYEGDITISIDPKNVAGEMYPKYILLGLDNTLTPTVTQDIDLFDTAPDDPATGTADETITILPAVVKIIDKGATQVASIKPEEYALREDAGRTPVELLITLANKVTNPNGQTVKIGVIAKGDDVPSGIEGLDEDMLKGTRDVDYRVSVSSIEIPKDGISGTATVIVTPIPDSDDDDAAFYVTAAVGDTELKPILFTVDDIEEKTGKIRLFVDNDELYEGDDATNIEVTARLDGKGLDEAVVLDLTLDGTATRELDYEASLISLVIPKGDLSNSVTISIDPKSDSVAGDEAKPAGETIIVKDSDDKAGKNDGKSTALNPAVTVEPATITLKDGNRPGDTTTDDTTTDDTTTDVGPITLADDDPDIKGTVDDPLEVVFAEATPEDEETELNYFLTGDLSSVGLSLDMFDPETQTLSGTPTKKGEVEVQYLVN